MVNPTPRHATRAATATRGTWPVPSLPHNPAAYSHGWKVVDSVCARRIHRLTPHNQRAATAANPNGSRYAATRSTVET
ncbi:hypothetical protein A3Q40_03410 [Rhodococcus sp. PBTS 1]|nr:hypothetical protein A3Q40_03410 [Rhodococcus sp. PBTS 1]